MFKGSLLIPSGNLWKITRGYERKDKQKDTPEKQYYYKASRKFKNVKEFNDWLSSDTASGTIKIKVKLEKRFRWFYTYYEYSETYPMTFPFKNVPVDSFLTETEQSVIMEDGRAVYAPIEKKWILKKDTLKFQYDHTDSMEIRKMYESCELKMELWMTTAIVNEFSDLVKNLFVDDPAYFNLKEKLCQHIEIIRDKVYLKTLISLADSVAHCNKLLKFYLEKPLVFSDFERKIESVNISMISDSYECNLGMPGEVYSTNAFERDPISLRWKFEQMQFFMKDYEMKAESRAANPWIMVLTGMVAVMLIFILVVRRSHNT